MYDLAETIGAPVYAAYGIMEAIWHHAGDYAPDGDIGKLTDAAIARAVGWRDQPSILIDALVKTRWLDKNERHRLIIHDWPDHAQDWVRKKLKRIQGKKSHEPPDWLQVYDKSQNMTSHGPVTDQSRTSHGPVTSSLTDQNDVNFTDQSLTSHGLAPMPVTDQPRAGGLREVKGGIGTSGSFDSEKEKTLAPSFSQNGKSSRWDLDEQFGLLRLGFDDAGVATIDADWADAYFVWPKLDFTQKLAAIEGIRNLKGRDPDFIKRPRKYLETSEWERVKVKAARVKPFVDPLPTTEELLRREKEAEPEEERQRAERRKKREAEKLAKGEKIETTEEIEARLKQKFAKGVNP